MIPDPTTTARPVMGTPSATSQSGHIVVPGPVPSDNLLGLQGSLHIAHRGAIYTLRATSKGGLILTK